jgi:hypothetical protein
MLSKIIDFGIFSILFFSSYILFGLPFEFYINYIPLILLLFIFIFKYKFPTKILYLFIPLLIFGLINIFYDNNTFGSFIKIFSNILISVTFFYYVFEYYEKDIKRFFQTYMQWCVVVSVIGLIQLVSYLVGFVYGYDFGLIGLNKWGVIEGGFGIRINSIFCEPSYFASTVGPAFFISVYNLIFNKSYFINRKKAIIISIAYLLTFSSLAYLSILIVLLLLLYNYGLVRYILLSIPILLVIFSFIYNNVSEFKERYDGFTALYFDGILENQGTSETKGGFLSQNKSKINILGKVHGSSFVQYNNFVITKTNFYKNPFFGTGLGSHQFAFEKYNLNAFMGDKYRNNNSDANSMLLRIISETGLFGLIFIFLFIKNNYVKRNEDTEKDPESMYIWLISNAVLVIILLQLIRQGNYTFGGFMAYMWLYYYAYQANASLKMKKVENELIVSEHK